MTTCTPAVPARSGSRILGKVVIIVAVGAVVFGIARELRRSSQPASPLVTPAAALADVSVTIPTVYYFHGDTRCPTCISIEEQTTALVQSIFAQDIAAGRLRFRVVNFDIPADRHFRDDYQLAFGSVVVSNAGSSKWENLSDVWSLVHDDRAAFDRYLIEHIQPYVKAGS